ncbi:MAG: hypothetical protein LBV23_10515 [Deltaproteobacteria bacterium]|jgi:hypothetical protein|nr:hypothetical protein [Deltaproteobacteria bacterium]
MRVDSNAEIYYKQYDLNYHDIKHRKVHEGTDWLKLNQYFDSIRRSRQLRPIDITLEQQKNFLSQLLKSEGLSEDRNAVKPRNGYYKTFYD